MVLVRKDWEATMCLVYLDLPPCCYKHVVSEKPHRCLVKELKVNFE